MSVNAVPDRLKTRDQTVRSVVRAWRRLTSPSGDRRAGPGAPTLVACSGGADSSALAIVLAGTGTRVGLAYIEHDMREPAVVAHEAARCAEMASWLSVPFYRAAVSCSGGNAEQVARVRRYASLASIAHDHDYGFVATGHHADDQMESVLLALVRGAGPASMRGISARTDVGTIVRGHGIELDDAAAEVRVVRPMLSQTRAEAERVCERVGWAWSRDETNHDESRLRAAIRHRVAPAFRSVRPDVAQNAGRYASLMVELVDLLDARVESMLTPGACDWSEDGASWRRAELAAERGIVVGAVLRAAAARLLDGEGSDDLGKRSVDPIVHAVRDVSGEARRFELGGVRVEVSKEAVRMNKREESP